MNSLIEAFDNRLKEIDIYLELLDAIDIEIKEGKTPRIGIRTITVEQQKILYSSVYLQLYNLVESTITRCLEAVSFATSENKQWFPKDLSDKLRREWVRYVANTHEELSYDNRLEAALKLCEHLVEALPITSDFNIAKGEGGNWDDVAIHKISNRLGLSLRISREVEINIKRAFRDDQGALAFIKSLRNKLAHGNLSFVECGENVTVADLHKLKDLTALYLREVVNSFKASIDEYEFLQPDRRPQDEGKSA